MSANTMWKTLSVLEHYQTNSLPILHSSRLTVQQFNVYNHKRSPM